MDKAVTLLLTLPPDVGTVPPGSGEWTFSRATNASRTRDPGLWTNGPIRTVVPDSTVSPMPRRISVVLIVWLAMVGLDFVLNAGLFASIYRTGGTFLLAPLEAFRRIPFGYLAFLILAAGVVELAARLGITRTADGVRLGLASGATLAASWGLGLYSIATLTPSQALAFAAIWLALLTVAGGVAAAGLGRASLRGLALRVAGAVLLAAITVIALQSFGVLPTLTS